MFTVPESIDRDTDFISSLKGSTSEKVLSVLIGFCPHNI